jgi:hypothetical protein
MNPLFKNPIQMNPMQRIGQVVRDVQMLQQNPTQLGQYLSDHGMLDQSQLSEIQNMNPVQVGQYLMQKGVMPQQGVQQAYQTMVPTIQGRL